MSIPLKTRSFFDNSIDQSTGTSVASVLASMREPSNGAFGGLIVSPKPAGVARRLACNPPQGRETMRKSI